MSCFRLGSVFHRINRNRRINNSGFFGSVGRRSLLSMSIESIKLKINDKSKGPRQMYGEIKVLDPLIYIFRRHRYEAQLVPDGDDGDDDSFPLILCGPNNLIQPDYDGDSISVDLYDESSRPFITSNFVLMDNHNFGRIQIPIQEYVYTLDGSARLTLTYTRIHHSYPFIFQFQLIQAQAEAEAAVAVSGTIRGIQLMPEGTTNWITIFDSRGEAVVVPKGEPIPLDRFYFVVPIQRRTEERFRGGSFNIDVDLQVHTKFKGFFIKGLANIVVEFNRHLMWADHPLDPMFFTVGRSSYGPVIQISLKKIQKCWRVEGDSEQSLEHS